MHLRHFLINETLDVAQDESGAEGFRHLSQRGFDACTVFRMHGGIERRFLRIDQQLFQPDGSGVSALVDLLFDGYFLLPVTHPPAPLVGCFPQRDPVNPRAQARFAVEIAHPAEDLDEDFLGEVRGIGTIVHGAREERIDGLVVTGDEPGEGLLGTSAQLDYEGRLLRPKRQRAG